MCNLQGAKPWSTVGDGSQKQYSTITSEDAMKATVSVHANLLESVTGLPVQVSGVPGVSDGDMRGCEVLGWFTMFTRKLGTAGEHWNISERKNGYI